MLLASKRFDLTIFSKGYSYIITVLVASGSHQMETGQEENPGKAQKAATLWFQMEL